MSEHDPHDPWASLAESLGAAPTNEPTRQSPPPKPQASSSRPKTPQRPKPAAESGSWDQLAADLGVAGGAEPRPAPRPVARPPVEPARRTADDERPPRQERRSADEGAPRRERPPRFSDDHQAEREATREVDASRDSVGESTDRPRPAAGESGDDDGERRGRRRRRGRRGGRGRSRRDGDRAERPDEASGERPADGPGERRPERDLGPRDDDSWSGAARLDDDRDIAAAADDATEPRAERGEGGEAGSDESRPRRRRRGRRGGRGRRRGEGGDRIDGAQEGSPREPSAAGELDDEPLPTAYGMRPRTGDTAGRGDAPRADRPAESREASDASGEGRGRRRRRRRGGEGRSRSESESGSREPGSSRSRTRSGRRSGDSRSSSYSRGRRDDFAPVAGRHEDDDEGLEFLGVEEAGQDAPRRQRAAEDEDILVESGLNTVLDVPSWVEAIGIVIAGNLDARNKGRGGDRAR